ncbi:MAG: 4-hydroxybenzoate 3-monooxygenase [Ilumatobacteraceae bacterium]
MKVPVVIIGAGPAGTLLSHMLGQAGVDNVVLELRSREYVLGRVRAGVLEWSTVETLRQFGLAGRMDAEGHVHDLINIAWSGHGLVSIDTVARVGKEMMGYGQTELQRDLYDAADASGATIVFEATDIELHDLTSATPSVTYRANGVAERIECDFIAGCDGFHGVSRTSIPAAARTEFAKDYPFGWLGILSETPPLPVLTYARHERGFALCSRRTPMLSRYYVQAPLTDDVDEWPDDRFWSELLARLPADLAAEITTGPSVEKSLAPLRSFVCEPMRHGRLFLAGDAAHIVPPTGAKGLNLAVSDVWYLSRGLVDHYAGDDHHLDTYSATALQRVWGAVRFSWWMTTMLHQFPGQTAFDDRVIEHDLAHLARSTFAQAAFAEQYVGLPYDQA